MKCRRDTEVVVATDSPEIVEAVTRHGGRAMLTRPDHPSGSDRVAEVTRTLGVDLVVNLQGDEPFIVPADVERVIDRLLAGGSDIVTLRTPIRSTEELIDPSAVKVVCRDDGEALYFSRAPIPFDRHGREAFTGAYRHLGVYGYSAASLERFVAAPPHPLEQREGLEQLRALALGLRIHVLDAETEGVGIDTPEDLTLARQRYAELGEGAFPC
jgi:3-deoxy-manno-octulosonate cytidylyltransferase (CMP-KDO synthetase)